MTLFTGKLQQIEDISEVNPPEEYIKIWEDVSKEVQERKALNYRLSEEAKNKCFTELQRRPYYLASIAERLGVKTIAEVGTAQGLQFYSFAHMLKNYNGKIWSCDIIDVRNQEYAEKYKTETRFCLGDSQKLKEQIKEDNCKIDLFYIDGAHDYGDVIRDVYNLKEVQSENPIWIFDDFDERFGCYRDIQMLMEKKDDVRVYRVGNAASGNPNHQVIVRGKY
jgi:predicted O-methyltransferase YrrM